MSLLETLCWLREELPLQDRAAPKRVLLEHYLSQEHALLQQSSALEGDSGYLPGLERIPQAEISPDRRVGSSSTHNYYLWPPSRIEVVEDMFRKARLKRCFTRIVRQHRGAGENHQPAPGGPRPPSIGDHLDPRAEERRKEVEFGRPRLAPVMHDQDVFERGSPERPVPPVEPPIHRGQGEDEDEAERHRILLGQFFHATRRRDDVARDDRLDLGADRAPAAVGGAPCFTVGGRGRSSIASTRSSGQQGVDEHGTNGLPRFGLRRANLLRRVLQAMRESARERVLEVDTPSPPRHHASQDHLPRPPSMTMPGDQCLSLQSLPHRGYLPVHPRQVSRATEAYQAVFEALAMLLPLRSGGDGGAGARGGIGRMQAAAVRCGQQCQGYIRALQQGIEVERPGAPGNAARFRVVLQVETSGGTGVSLALHDIDAPREAVAAAGPTGEEVVESGRRDTPASTTRLPLARVTRVKCLPGSTENGESFRFVILAAREFDGASCRPQGFAGPLGAEGVEEEPFGMLRATSGAGFRALVLGVASVKSALDSPFRTRRVTNAAIRHPLPGFNPVGSSSSGASASTRPAPGPPAKSSPSSSVAAAAACLPWQGARVCIVELAPTLTFFGAVRAVEAVARRVGREHGVSLRDQGLLICSDPQY